MILKELDAFSSEDKFLRAGRAAEEKMAFYLRTYFEDAKDVFVLNSIRVEPPGEEWAIQMDHMVIHPFGLFIIESKSVTGKVQIKEDGQWVRWFKDKSSGMQDPIVQSEIQAMRLKKLLSRQARPATFFDAVPFDSVVAISDQGQLLPSLPPRVYKADQIPQVIQTKLGTSRQVGQAPLLQPAHMEKLGEFLVVSHRPWVAQKPPERPSVPEGTKCPSAHVCKHCGSSKLRIRWGERYKNYYFECLDCMKNTSIRTNCEACGEKVVLHKEGKNFYSQCKACKTSVLFYVNP